MASDRRAAVGLFAAQASIALINLPVTIILARALSPDGLGQYQFLNRIALLAISVAHLGLPHAMAWAAQQTKDPASRRRALGIGVAAAAVAGGLVAAIGFATSSIQQEPELELAWALFSCYPLANLIAANIANYYRGTLDVRRVATIRVAQAVSWLAITLIIFLNDGLSLTTAVVALLASQVVAAVVALAAVIGDPHLRLGASAIKSRGRRPSPSGRQIGHFAARLYPGLMLRDWYLYLDQIVIGLVLSSSQLGVYSVAASLSVALGLLASPIVNTVQPLVQRCSVDLRLATVSHALALTALLIGAPAILLAALAPTLIPIIYGQAYHQSVALAQILAGAAVLDAVAAACYGILLGLGHPGRSSVAVILGVAMNTALLLVLIPFWGITGAAWASFTSYAAVAFISLRSVAKAGSWPVLQLAGRVLHEARLTVVRPLVWTDYRRHARERNHA